MTRSLIALALALTCIAAPSKPQNFNWVDVRSKPIDVGDATLAAMTWNGGNYGEPLRSSDLKWSDTGRTKPIHVACYSSSWAENRWIYVHFDEKREHATIRAYVNTDYGDFPVSTLRGTELSLDEDELRFRILARYQGAEKPEVWLGRISVPKD
jgi:hypothetical protein